MVKFVDVDPSELTAGREGRRGRVSYPIIKTFMETGKVAAKLDRTGMQQSLVALTSCLNSYIRNHNMPIKVMQRGGELYLMRLDLDDEGNPIEDWDAEKPTEGHAASGAGEEAKPITSDEVSARYEQEKGQVTK